MYMIKSPNTARLQQGRCKCFQTLSKSRASKHRHQATIAQGSSLEDTIRKTAAKIRASLPVIGLISSLTSPEGNGVGTQSYQEFCRQVFDVAPLGFQIAVAELQNKYGKPAQRKNVLLCLWMARLGAGLVPEDAITRAAGKLHISQDIEFEMDKFNQQYEEELSKYRYGSLPPSSNDEKARISVNALINLCCGLPESRKQGVTVLGREELELMADAVTGGFYDVEGFRESVMKAIDEVNV